MSSFRTKEQWSFCSLDVHCPITAEEREDEELLLDGLSILREAMDHLRTLHPDHCRCAVCRWRRDALDWQDRCMGGPLSPPPTLRVLEPLA